MERKIIGQLSILLTLLGIQSSHVQAYDGQNFTAMTTEGVEVLYQVISETSKTCRTTYVNNNTTQGACINQSTYGTVTIPAYANGYRVTEIGMQSFDQCKKLESVILPDGIQTIGVYAFRGSYNIKSISVPNSVRSIGDYAFSGCSEITSINIPSGIDAILDGTFGNCNNLFSITIPTSVTSIGKNAFYACRNLTTLTLPEGLTTIGEGAFMGCGITEITIPKSVTRINDATFMGSSLQTIIFPETVTYIGCQVFTECPYLKSVTLPEGLTSIQESTFSGCPQLSSIRIPGNVTTIGDNAFESCEGLSSIALPDGLMSIGDNAFSYCESLSSIALPDGLKSIGDNAFSYCESLSSIALPDGLISIGTGAFADCTQLTSLTFPEEITNLGNAVCNRDTSLVSVTLPLNITMIGPNFFQGCYNLRSVQIPEGVVTIGGSCFSMCSDLTAVQLPECVESIGANAFSGCKSLTSISIPHGVTRLEEGLFAGCQNLENIQIPNTVAAIGSGVFQGCSSLRSLDIPDAVSVINDRTFQNCSALQSIRIPENVTSIGVSAFNGCQSLLSLTIPAKVTNIGSNAFVGCGGLESMAVDAQNTVYDSRDNCNAIIETKTNVLLAGCKNTTIPQGVTRLREKAFEGCQGLSAIFIPKSVESIERGVFNGCSNLSSIVVEEGNPIYDSRSQCNAIIETATNTLLFGCSNTSFPSDVTVIGEYAFQYCNFQFFTIPESVTSIGTGAFFQCEKLEGINLPDSLTSLGDHAFYNCASLTSIRLPDNLRRIEEYTFTGCVQLDAVYMSDSVNSIGLAAFSNCTSLRTFTLPRCIKRIERSLFSECTNLESINIPDSVTTIGGRAFEDCRNLTFIMIPENVATIEFSAFSGCSSLSIVWVQSPVPPSLDSSAPFDTYRNKNMTLVIPQGSEAVYFGTRGWRDFAHIMEQQELPGTIEDGQLMITASDPAATIYYSTDGYLPSLLSSRATGTVTLESIFHVYAFAFDVDNDYFAYYQPISYYFDGSTVTLNDAGRLGYAISGHQNGLKHLTVVGHVNQDDLTVMQSLTSLRTLDLQKAIYNERALPAHAFADMNIVECRLPEQLGGLGANIFAGCNQLAAITWNSREPIPAETLAGINNPNLLLYVKDERLAVNAMSDGIGNIVANGQAREIVLCDATGNANFYCPEAFLATSISYTHNYQLTTPINGCGGWETIALPFTVQSITHDSKGTLAPFLANQDDVPAFWLSRYGDMGFAATDVIQANKPYIISMPNNALYSDEYNLCGQVTFSATYTEVPQTMPLGSTRGSVTLMPCFQQMEKADSVYALNIDDETNAGSMFVGGGRAVRPFEAYATTTTPPVKGYIPLFEDETSSIAHSTLLSQSPRVPIYNLQGQQVCKVGKGIYIKNGTLMIQQ